MKYEFPEDDTYLGIVFGIVACFIFGHYNDTDVCIMCKKVFKDKTHES